MSHRLGRISLVRGVLALTMLGAIAAISLLSLGGGAAAADRPARASHAPTHPGSASSCSNPATDRRTCTLSPSEAMPTAAPLTAAQRARLARTGSIEIAVHASAPGTFTAVGQATIGEDDETVTEPASVTASQPGSVELPLVLTDSATARLAAGEQLELVLQIRSSNSPVGLVMLVPLAVG